MVKKSIFGFILVVLLSFMLTACSSDVNIQPSTTIDVTTTTLNLITTTSLQQTTTSSTTSTTLGGVEIVEGSDIKTGLNITSKPLSMHIYINKTYYETTPRVVYLAPGTYMVTLKKSGYEDYAKKITVPEEGILNLPVIAYR